MLPSQTMDDTSLPPPPIPADIQVVINLNCARRSDEKLKEGIDNEYSLPSSNHDGVAQNLVESDNSTLPVSSTNMEQGPSSSATKDTGILDNAENNGERILLEMDEKTLIKGEESNPYITFESSDSDDSSNDDGQEESFLNRASDTKQSRRSLTAARRRAVIAKRLRREDLLQRRNGNAWLLSLHYHHHHHHHRSRRGGRLETVDEMPSDDERSSHTTTEAMGTMGSLSQHPMTLPSILPFTLLSESLPVVIPSHTEFLQHLTGDDMMRRSRQITNV
jgi:hypothetical protein